MEDTTMDYTTTSIPTIAIMDEEEMRSTMESMIDQQLAILQKDITTKVLADVRKKVSGQMSKIRASFVVEQKTTQVQQQQQQQHRAHYKKEAAVANSSSTSSSSSTTSTEAGAESAATAAVEALISIHRQTKSDSKKKESEEEAAAVAGALMSIRQSNKEAAAPGALLAMSIRDGSHSHHRQKSDHLQPSSTTTTTTTATTATAIDFEAKIDQKMERLERDLTAKVLTNNCKEAAAAAAAIRNRQFQAQQKPTCNKTAFEIDAKIDDKFDDKIKQLQQDITAKVLAEVRQEFSDQFSGLRSALLKSFQSWAATLMKADDTKSDTRSSSPQEEQEEQEETKQNAAIHEKLTSLEAWMVQAIATQETALDEKHEALVQTNDSFESSLQKQKKETDEKCTKLHDELKSQKEWMKEALKDQAELYSVEMKCLEKSMKESISSISSQSDQTTTNEKFVKLDRKLKIQKERTTKSLKDHTECLKNHGHFIQSILHGPDAAAKKVEVTARLDEIRSEMESLENRVEQSMEKHSTNMQLDRHMCKMNRNYVFSSNKARDSTLEMLRVYMKLKFQDMESVMAANGLTVPEEASDEQVSIRDGQNNNQEDDDSWSTQEVEMSRNKKRKLYDLFEASDDDSSRASYADGVAAHGDAVDAARFSRELDKATIYYDGDQFTVDIDEGSTTVRELYLKVHYHTGIPLPHFDLFHHESRPYAECEEDEWDLGRVDLRLYQDDPISSCCVYSHRDFFEFTVKKDDWTNGWICGELGR